MNEPDLEVVDGLTLSEEHRVLLRPGEPVAGENGKIHHLPRFFYSVPSWAAAREIRCAPHFKFAELMSVDRGEAPLLRDKFPHYVPCAVALLAGYLEAFRRAADAAVFVSVNGGYRSPAHQQNHGLKSMHCWGTAADIYRIGDTYLDDEKSIARFAEIAGSLSRQVFVRPYAEGDDHLGIDLGFVMVTPRGCSEIELAR